MIGGISGSVDLNYNHNYGVKDSNEKGNIEGECQTCNSRKYIDGSNDNGVSFQSPTHVSPEASFSAVRSHEGEHVKRETNKAFQNDGKVLSQSVTYSMETCPECGKLYTAGGLTKTVVKYGGEEFAKGKVVDELI